MNRTIAFLVGAILTGDAVSPELRAQSWISTGPRTKNIRALAQSPVTPLVFFAGSFGSGVFKSTDGGTTWVNFRSGLSNTYIRSIIVVTDNLVFAGTNEGVAVSTNGGRTWTTSLETANSVRALAYDPNASALYAATYGSGIYKSIDMGVAWSPLTVTDPVAGETLARVRSLAVYANNALYAGGSIGDIAAGGALFRSTDGGAGWTQVQRGTGIRSTVRSIAISPRSPQTTLIIGTAANGVYRSTNAGLNWSNIDSSGVEQRISDRRIGAVAFSPTFMYAATDSSGELYYRDVNDATVGWLQGTGLPGVEGVVNALVIDGSDSARILIGTEGKGVHVSGNGGSNWSPLNAGMMGVAARALERNTSGTLFLGTDFGDGIWRSANQATTWIPADSLATANPITSFGITSNSAVIYAGAYGTGVLKSTNGGSEWVATSSAVIPTTIRTLAVHPSNPNQVFAGTGDGVYRTDNGGVSWTEMNAGLSPGTSVRCMVLDPRSPATIYVGTDSNYLYKTTNSGASWTHVTNADGFLLQDSYIRSIAIDPVLSHVVYAGADSGRVYRSSNGGLQWTLQVQIPSNNSVRSILVHPANRLIVFAATFGSGVFISTDTARTWLAMNGGLTDRDIYALEAEGTSPLTLYAGTGSEGVFKLSYTFTSRSEDNSGQPSEFTLLGNYPNPFNASTEIRYSLAGAGNVLLKIYDVLGRTVAELTNARQGAAFYTVRWDAGDRASGMYFYELQVVDPGTGRVSYRGTRKMILMK